MLTFYDKKAKSFMIAYEAPDLLENSSNFFSLLLLQWFFFSFYVFLFPVYYSSIPPGFIVPEGRHYKKEH